VSLPNFVRKLVQGLQVVGPVITWCQYIRLDDRPMHEQLLINESYISTIVEQ
jgi:hypothetical protein